MTSEVDSQPAHLMPCMEVWGGNRAVDSGVVMAGLDAWVYNRPCHEAAAGGDVYYVSSCATGRVTRMLVADISGHGEAVAETGAGLRLLMRRYVNHIDQRRFVVALNEQFTDLVGEGGFATAVAATFFGPSRELTVCNAGHPPPLVYRARRRAWSEVREAADDTPGDLSNVPLGVIEGTDYRETRLRLQVGDLVLSYTDSLIESKGPDGRLLGLEGLLGLVRGLDPGPPETLLSALREAIVALDPENLEGDDVTMLLVRANGLTPRVPLRERVLAPLRLVRGWLASLRPGGQPMPWPELSVRNIGGAMIDAFNRRR